MTQTLEIIKRNGMRASENFERDKLHHSIRAACLSVRSLEGEAEQTAHRVCNVVLAWCHDKTIITSDDVRRKASEALAVFHPEAAYFYQQHRLVI